MEVNRRKQNRGREEDVGKAGGGRQPREEKRSRDLERGDGVR